MSSIKAVVYGNSGVGKTTLIKRLRNLDFSVKFRFTKDIEQVEIENVTYWDIAGTKMYTENHRIYENVDAGILMFDITNVNTIGREFFTHLSNFHKKNPDKLLVIIGNKADSAHLSITSEKIETLIFDIQKVHKNTKYFRISLKTCEYKEIHKLISEN